MLIGTLRLIVPADCARFPLWSLARPQLIPWVISPADIHPSLQVFTTTRWFLLICFLSQMDGGRALAGLQWAGRPLKAGKTFSRATQKPRLTDCTRPGPLFTLSRCGLPLVFLSNYPSLTESMCQSNSLRVRAGPGREQRRKRDPQLGLTNFFKPDYHFRVITRLKAWLVQAWKCCCNCNTGIIIAYFTL